MKLSKLDLSLVLESISMMMDALKECENMEPSAKQELLDDHARIYEEIKAEWSSLSVDGGTNNYHDGSVAKRLATNGLYVCVHNAWKEGDEEQYESIHSLASRISDDTATEDDWAEVMEYLIDEDYEEGK